MWLRDLFVVLTQLRKHGTHTMLESIRESVAINVQSDSENAKSTDEDHDQFFVLHRSSTLSASSQCLSDLRLRRRLCRAGVDHPQIPRSYVLNTEYWIIHVLGQNRKWKRGKSMGLFCRSSADITLTTALCTHIAELAVVKNVAWTRFRWHSYGISAKHLSTASAIKT